MNKREYQALLPEEKEALRAKMREYQKNWYYAHREEKIARSKQYYFKHKAEREASPELQEEYLAKRREYQRNNKIPPEKRREYQKRYYEKHKEEILRKQKERNAKKKVL